MPTLTLIFRIQNPVGMGISILPLVKRGNTLSMFIPHVVVHHFTIPYCRPTLTGSRCSRYSVARGLVLTFRINHLPSGKCGLRWVTQ